MPCGSKSVNVVIFTFCGFNVNNGIVKNSWFHLASNGSLPDQIIKDKLIFIQIFFYLFRFFFEKSWPNCLVSLLSSFTFSFVEIRFNRKILFAEILVNQFPNFVNCLTG